MADYCCNTYPTKALSNPHPIALNPTSLLIIYICHRLIRLEFHSQKPLCLCVVIQLISTMARADSWTSFASSFKAIPMHEIFKFLESLADDQAVSGKSSFRRKPQEIWQTTKGNFFCNRNRQKFWKFACLYIVIIMQSPSCFQLPNRNWTSCCEQNREISSTLSFAFPLDEFSLLRGLDRSFNKFTSIACCRHTSEVFLSPSKTLPLQVIQSLMMGK
jgi:hypothetical protein